jgi:hypothetical protein
VRRAAGALVLLATLAGCGGGHAASEPARPTHLTVPSAPRTTPAPTGTTTQAPAPAPPPGTGGSGGAPAPRTTPEDSPRHDVPPPKGSPAERFERFCDQNPGACG